jgi:CubicO group peptidase (beta-lactamase class C family)
VQGYFKSSEYGATSIRDLLHMSSGVEFGETKDGQRDLNGLWIDMVLGLGPTKGTINSIVQFTGGSRRRGRNTLMQA